MPENNRIIFFMKLKEGKCELKILFTTKMTFESIKLKLLQTRNIDVNEPFHERKLPARKMTE